MSLSIVLFFVVGLVLLIVGAEILVRGASRLAIALGISPLVVGLTVVAFGTSSPELAVSVKAALGGSAVGLGNVVGSNICNVLFILGLSALVVPLTVAAQLIRQDVPVMIGASVLVLLLALDGSVGRLDGGVLALLLVGYIVFLVVQSRGAEAAVQAEFAEELPERHPRTLRAFLLDGIFVVGGLGLLILGSRWLVESSVAGARALGVSDVIIGLTIVALGTSAPEIATSVMASLRGERDIAVGNAVGSNVFNLLCVLGISAVVAPDGVAVDRDTLTFDLPVMVAAAVACLPIFFTGNRVARGEGALFLGYYVAYTVVLILRAVKSEALPLVKTALVGFVLPLSVVTLGVFVVREVRARRA